MTVLAFQYTLRLPRGAAERVSYLGTSDGHNRWPPRCSWCCGSRRLTLTSSPSGCKTLTSRPSSEAVLASRAAYYGRRVYEPERWGPKTHLDQDNNVKLHARNILEYWYDLAYLVSEGMSSILLLEACAAPVSHNIARNMTPPLSFLDSLIAS